jgi:hypothetical protein
VDRSDDDHPDLNTGRTDPAELAWHLYRHHGLDLAALAGDDITQLWDLHERHHEVG